MIHRLTLEAVLELLQGDREILEQLCRAGLLPDPGAGEYSEDEAETARVARVLVRELEVNWAGAEIVLRLRAELLSTRQQLAEMLSWVRAHLAPG